MIVFTVSIIFLLLLAVILITYPVKHNKLLQAGLLSIMIPAVFVGYWHWGSYQDWTHHTKAQVNKARLNESLREFDNPEQVIAKMKQHLAKQSQSAKGWYLLGKLHLSQNQFNQARDAFLRAYQLSPNDISIQLNLAQSYIMLQQISKAMPLLDKILENSTNNIEAMSLKAMAAYQQGNYPLAIDNWRQLLTLVPPNSKDSQLIEQAIAKAQEIKQGKETRTPTQNLTISK